MNESYIDMQEIRGLKSRVNELALKEASCEADKKQAIANVTSRINNCEAITKELHTNIQSIKDVFCGTPEAPEKGWAHRQLKLEEMQRGTFAFIKWCLGTITTCALGGFFIWVFTQIGR